MFKKQGVRTIAIFYSLALLWAAVFTATMWRLNVLDGPHWLKLSYLVLAIAWVPVAVVFLVFLRKPSIVYNDWGYRSVTTAAYALISVFLAFIGLCIADCLCGVS